MCWNDTCVFWIWRILNCIVVAQLSFRCIRTCFVLTFWYVVTWYFSWRGCQDPRRPKYWCHKYYSCFIIFFQGSAFQSLLPAVKDKIIESFTPEARDMFEREFDFFDKVTSISGVLFPLPKDERRAGIRR